MGAKYDIDRTDVYILSAFQSDGATLDNPAIGITITEIMEYLDGINARKSRKTVRTHVLKLMEADCLAKGIVSDHADTYYIRPTGKKRLEGDMT